VAVAVVSEARAEILGRVRAALRDVALSERPEEVSVERAYRAAGTLAPQDVVALFAERVSDYRATVLRAPADGIRETVEETCRSQGLHRVAVPAAVPKSWLPDSLEIVEDSELTARELDAVDGVLTGCATAIAQTGTLVLDGRGACGRRILTLVPDCHICVVTADQVVELVPQGIAAVAPPAPVTLISGPSASSDIELQRVEGVHGPRRLVVVLADT